MNARPCAARGFTLLEVIVTLVLLGIMATMVGPYLARTVSSSGTPLTNLQNEIALQSWMEQIIAYNNEVNDLDKVMVYVDSKAAGNYSVIANGYCELDASNVFQVKQNPTTKNMLLVTIKSLTTGEQLTTLLTK